MCLTFLTVQSKPNLTSLLLVLTRPFLPTLDLNIQYGLLYTIIFIWYQPISDRPNSIVRPFTLFYYGESGPFAI